MSLYHPTRTKPNFCFGFMLLLLLLSFLSCVYSLNSHELYSDKISLHKTFSKFKTKLILPDKFEVEYKLTQRSDNSVQFNGVALFSRTNDSKAVIRVKSISSKQRVYIVQNDKKQAVHHHKHIYFDSTKHSYREIVQDEDKSFQESLKSARIIPTTPLDFQHLFEAIQNNTFLIPENLQTYDYEVNTKCPTNLFNRFLTFFEHQHYVVCSFKFTNNKNLEGRLSTVKYIISDQFIIDVFRFKVVNKWMSESTPLFSELDEKLFPSKVETVLKTKDEKELLKSEQYSGPSKAWLFNRKHICSLNWLKDSRICPQDYEVVTTNKTCIFLHGVGQWITDKGPPVHSFPEYWGNIDAFTPQCTERWFIREETKFRGWNNAELQQSYCSLSLVNNTGTVIKDKIIFTHSMGTMILAAAIRNGVCSIDNNSVSWYDVQGPMRGSKAATMLLDICSRASSWTSPSIYKIIAEEGGYCLGGNSTLPYPAYSTLAPDFPGVKELVNYVNPYLSGQMCGQSAYGLNSIYSVPLYLLSSVVGYGEPNDGMVPDSSCIVNSNANFTTNFADLFYKVNVNHADGTCRNGDAYFGSSKPCSFYVNKV
ncbi:hypothetical protein ABK040_010337 [Willaertia magna]